MNWIPAIVCLFAFTIYCSIALGCAAKRGDQLIAEALADREFRRWLAFQKALQ